MSLFNSESMDPGQLLKTIFDPKLVAVMRLFLHDREKEYYLREVSKLTRVSPATTLRIIRKLHKAEILQEIRIKKFKLYRLAVNENVTFLESFMKEETHILNEFVNSLKILPGVQSVILHGKDQPDRANVLIIGENVDSGQTKALCGAIREKYRFTISALTLTQDQFEQMSSMGLYSGEKKLVYRRDQS